MKFIDLFAGVGGFRLGAEKHGHECVFSSEIDKFACDTYEANFGERPHGDITKVDPEDIPDHDLLCAGFPCQPWSVAGKKKGMDDPRGRVFDVIPRILKAKKPEYFLLENVPALEQKNNKKHFDGILKSLKSCGYNVIYFTKILTDLGVAQKRTRLFILGSRGS